MYSAWQFKLLTARVLEKARVRGLAQRCFLMSLKSAPEANRASLHYRLAHAYTSTNDHEGARAHFLAALEGNPLVPHWWYRLGLTEQKLGNRPGAIDAWERAAGLNPTKPADIYTVAKSMSKLNDAPGAMNRLRAALEVEPRNRRFHTLMIALAVRTNQQPVIKKALEEALHNFPANGRWLPRLVDIYEITGEAQQSVELLAAYHATGAGNARTHFWVGRALLRQGKVAEAETRFATVVGQLNPDEQILGIGNFFEKAHQYADAIQYYRRDLESAEDPGPILYRLGRCYEAAYDWSLAVEAYDQAVKTRDAQAFWYGRLGVALEQVNNLHRAASAYSTAAEMDGRADNVWNYRYVKVQMLADSTSDLSAVLLNATQEAAASIGAKGTRVPLKFGKRKNSDSVFNQYAARTENAVKLLGKQSYDAAADEFEAAVYRASSHSRDLYLAWTYALVMAEQPEKAAEAYLRSRMIQSSFALESRGLLKKRESQQRIYFAELQDSLTIMQDAILYESGAGLTVACNPLAICRELLDSDEHKNLRHFWAVAKEQAVPEYLRNDPRVYIIRRGSDLYLKVLASAKYLINNNTFPPFFSRRPEQKYLNTWHGVPLKTLGIDIKNGQMDHRNAARNLLHATHMSMPNEHTRRILLERYDIQGLFTGLTAQVGYPRIDSIVAPRPQISADIRRRLKLTSEDRVLLYAPTWRGDLKNAKLDEARILADLARLEGTGYKVLFRGHTMVEKILADSKLKNSLVPANIDTNDLLAVIDVLVTDYSSIYFDFIPTGKPIFYYAYDLEEYKSERGMYFDLEDMPGSVCTTIEDLASSVSALTSWDLSQRADYVAAREKFCAHEDGRATVRTIDFFFNDRGADASSTPKRKITTLFYQGSFIPNGITSAFNNLIANIDHDLVRPVVMVLPNAVFSRPEREETLRALGEKIQTLGVIGGQLATLEERLIIDDFNRQMQFDNEAKSRVYFTGYEREFRRLFGYAEFDSVISFEGFQRHWSALMAAAPAPRLGRSIMLHSAMKRERDTRFSQLQAVFSLYPRFDHLISVSKSANEVNREDIGAETNIDAGRFEVAENLLDIESIRQLCDEEIDSEASAWIAHADYCFITVARLSPEKDHGKLVRALGQARSLTGKDLRLVIVGDGPTSNDLQDLTRELGLSGAVLFTGRLANPHPYVKAADAFAFSSNYEGQGIAVLESLVIGTPVVSTDVVGPRSVLEGGYGALVENSVDGLAEGLAVQAIEQPRYRQFDAEAYNEAALRKFNNIVFGI